MHIAIDARIISSGTGRYIERLLTHLEKLDSDHNYSVLVRAKDKKYWTPTKDNFKIVVADYADYSFAEQLGFYRFLKKLGPDLVHFCMPQQPLLYRGNIITTVHDLNLLRIDSNDMDPRVLRFKQKVFRKLLQTITKRSRYIITPSEYTKKDLLEFQNKPSDKVIVTPEGSEKFDSRPEVVDRYKGRQYIMYVGRAESYKNNRTMIKAHQRLLAKNPDLRLVIVGKKDKQRLDDMKWVKENDYANVDFVGFMSDGQLAWLYQNCQAYVFPSFMEGFGLPPLEAMQYGAPVVSSDATCLPEVLGDAALYFNPLYEKDMSNKIQTVISDKKLREEMIAKGNKQVNKYSWKKMAEQTLEVYNRSLRS